MNIDFDTAYHVDVICGVDEAGRGPLAGPVYAAAVVLRPKEAEGLLREGLDDSKRLSEAARGRLEVEIQMRAAAWAVASASVEEIETHNILGATFLAMERAVAALSLTPKMALVDGNRLPRGISVPCECVVKGDTLSPCIAAASVLAKVARDRYMRELALLYPQYGFERHKGYGTALHYERLQMHGACPAHRQSFLHEKGAKR